MEEENLQELTVLESLEKLSKTTIITTESIDNQFVAEELFGDFECGEPQKPRHLFFDFTPTDSELDAPEVREKVADFWQYLWAQKDIEKYCVMPEPGFENLSEADLPSPTPDLSTSSAQTTSCDRFETAIGALTEIGVAQPYEMVKESSETRICSGGYAATSKPLKYTISSTYKIGTSNTRDDAERKKAEVRALCEELEAWDERHPKSMDPPAHVSHHKVILHKALKPYEDINIKTCDCVNKHEDIEEKIENIKYV